MKPGTTVRIKRTNCRRKSLVGEVWAASQKGECVVIFDEKTAAHFGAITLSGTFPIKRLEVVADA